MSECGSATPERVAPRGSALSQLVESVAAFLAYTAVTAFFFRPFHRVWRDHLAPDLGDPLFNLYTLEWVQRQTRLGFPDLLGANFFFPLEDALALSDHLFGIALQALALQPLTDGEPVATYNLLVFLAFPLSGLAAAAVARACGFSRSASFVGGAVYAFAPYHWSQLSHLQILTYQWIPPTMWMFDRLLASPRAANAVGFLALYVLHVTGGSYLAFMIHIPLLVLLLNRALGEPGWRRLAAPRHLRLLVPTGLLAAGILLGTFYPYLRASGSVDFEWGAENYRIFGATLLSLFTPSSLNRHFDHFAPILSAIPRFYQGDYWWAEKSFFLGIVPIGLLLIGSWQLMARRRSPQIAPDWATKLAAVTALALFLTADLFTLGFWPDELPDVLRRPGAIYSLLGCSLLVALAIWAFLWTRASREPTRRPDRTRPTSSERGLLLACGTALLLCFPVFYEPLGEVLPGLSNMRVPARFFPFALVAAALLCARGTDALLSRLTSVPARALAGGALLALLLVELAPQQLPWRAIPSRDDLAPVYHWLADQPEVEALLELPLLPPPGETRYMYRSTIHWKPIVNGFSGHFPPHYAQLQLRCCWPVPDASVLNQLRGWGVTHLVVHPVWRKPWQRKAYGEWLTAVEAGEIEGVQQVFFDPATGDAVFDIRLKPRAAAVGATYPMLAIQRPG